MAKPREVTMSTTDVVPHTHRDHNVWKGVFYPETDGLPMDNKAQADLMADLIFGFVRVLDGQPATIVGGNFAWYPVEGDPRICVAPDVTIIRDSNQPIVTTYHQFRMGGYVQLAIEIISNANTAAGMAEKRAFFDRYGAHEYWEYDPRRATLRIWARRNGQFVEALIPPTGYASSVGGVTVSVDDDGALCVRDPDGHRWLSMNGEYRTVAQRADELASRVAALEAELRARE
jgi:hypothetical protein